jgi:acyl phosphate:glycerol-3-phosphate acyltransferase
MIAWAVWLLGAFAIGSIPFGYLVGRLFYRTDIRERGSGNIGAMNALRTLGKTGALAVLLLDAAKGFVPVAIAVHVFHSNALGALAAGAVVLGHCFSPWLGWHGGKGVATSFGAIFALSWPSGIVAVAAWLLGAGTTRYSSVGSILAHIVTPVALWWFTRDPAFVLYGCFALVLIIYTHRENLARLRAGTEGPIRLFSRQG